MACHDHPRPAWMLACLQQPFPSPLQQAFPSLRRLFAIRGRFLPPLQQTLPLLRSLLASISLFLEQALLSSRTLLFSSSFSLPFAACPTFNEEDAFQQQLFPPPLQQAQPSLRYLLASSRFFFSLCSRPSLCHCLAQLLLQVSLLEHVGFVPCLLLL